jgi:DUF4097 and DUF4098 domain-containing protein YvlB
MKAYLLLPLLALALPGPLPAATPIDETRAVEADALIEVENVAGSIRIRASQRTDLRVTGSLGDGADGLRIDGDARRLKVSVDHPRSGWTGWWGGGKVSDSVLDIELPEGVELKVKAVSASVDAAGLRGRRVAIEAVSGAVRFAGAPAELQIESVSGAIDAEAEAIGEVALESVSGRITLDGSVGQRLRAETVSGRIRLSPVGELQSVKVSTVSGGVELNTRLARGGRLDAESLSGELSVVLPAATSARLQASSFSGTIRSDVGEVEKDGFGPGSSLSATLGAGEGQIRLESFSGTLRLRLE